MFETGIVKKIIIVIVCFFMAQVSFAFYILLDTNVVKEGGIIRAKIGNPKPFSAAEMHLRGKTYPVFYTGYDPSQKDYLYTALVPISFDIIGKKTLLIKYAMGDDEKEATEIIKVIPLAARASKINTGQINKDFTAALHSESKLISKMEEKITSVKFKIPFIKPVQGRTSTDFGAARVYDDGKARWRHKGIDIAAPQGTTIVATSDGEVVAVYSTKTHGKIIVINHGAGVYSNYYHLSQTFVKMGSQVKKNQAIGAVGSTGLSTGPHLHWQINVFGIPVNPASFMEMF
ncbi:MAG: M23 family metallopeptidase [bacterium]